MHRWRLKFPVCRQVPAAKERSHLASLAQRAQHIPAASPTVCLEASHRIYAFCQWQVGIDPMSGRCYIVLEFAEMTLADVILERSDMGRGPLELAATCALMQHISCGLHLLHAKLGLVHGDVKPQNVAWFAEARAGQPKAGRWKLIDVDGALPSGRRQNLHRNAFFTAPYTAPEVAAALIEGRTCCVQPTYDSFSLGCVVLELLLQQNPLYVKWRTFCEADGAGGEEAYFRWLSDPTTPIELVPAPSGPLPSGPLPSGPLPPGAAPLSHELLYDRLRRLLHKDPKKRLSCSTLASDEALTTAGASAYLDVDTRLVHDMRSAAAPTFERGRAESAILGQALEALTLPSAERRQVLSDALSLAEGESVQAICERIARHELQRYEAATASGHPEPALSAFRFYQLMFPPPPELSAAKRALAASKAWKAADAGGVHKQWCEQLEAADRERFEREQLGA